MSYERCYQRLSAVAPKMFSVPGKLLWIGARIPGLHCFNELKDVEQEITILEAWEPNISLLSTKPGIDHLICGDVRDIRNIQLPYPYYDYVFWYQGPEHVAEDDLPEVLAALEDLSGFLLLGMSWGVYEQGAIYGNPYEVHLSHLDVPFFEELGYNTTTFGEKDVRGSELLAWKNVEDRPVDAVIPAAPKDYSKLPYVVDGILTYTPVRTVHLISPTDPEVACTVWHSDDDVLPYDRSRLRHRPDWVAQQLIKMFQCVTDADWFLVTDADIVINRDIPLWNSRLMPVFHLGLDQYHGPYFAFNEKMLGYGKVYDHSFLSECVLYNKRIVRELMDGHDWDTFWDVLVEAICPGCYPGDAEWYGSYVHNTYPDLYEFYQLKSVLGGRYGSHIWSDDEIRRELRGVRQRHPDADLISLHSWEGGV